MAKERRSSPEKGQTETQTVLNQILVEPLNQATVAQLGLDIPSDRSVGAFSYQTFALALRMRGLSKAECRTYTKQLTQSLGHTDKINQVPLPPAVKIRKARKGDLVIFHRSDVSPKEAIQIHDAHLEYLEKQKNLADAPPSTATVIVLSPFIPNDPKELARIKTENQ